MKFSSLQENLKQGLLIAGHIAGKNINLPILNNIMIKAEEGNIKLISTNLEIGIVHNIRGKTDMEGAFTVDSRLFSDYIGLLPNKKIDILQKDNNLVIECANFKTKINGQSAEDYPLIPEIDRGSYYSANVSEFKKALSQVVFAVAMSESRLELSGVYFNFNKNKLTLAATDSYRLAEKVINVKLNGTSEDLNIIIPAKTLQELIRILSNIKEETESGVEKEEIKFFVSDNQIMFTSGSTELVSRLIEGQYPDYKQIIPSTYKTKIIVNRQELIRAVKASALFSKTTVNDVNLDFPGGKNQAVVSSASDQAGESIINLDAEIQGQDNGMVINYKYLLDGLNNIESDNTLIEIIDNNTACILRPEKDTDYTYIIMPIKQ